MSYANDQYASVGNNIIGRQYGSSLLEVLISLTVLSFAFTSLVSFQAILFYNSNQAKLRTDAVAIADAKLEEFRHFNNIALYDAILSGSETIGPENSGAAIELSGLKAMFTRKWSVTSTNTHKVIASQLHGQDRGEIWLHSAKLVLIPLSLAWILVKA